MVKCKHCEHLFDAEKQIRRQWKLGKGKRKTIMANFLCPKCFKTFNQSLGSAVNGED